MGLSLAGVYASIRRRNKYSKCPCGRLNYDLANIPSPLLLAHSLPHRIGTWLGKILWPMQCGQKGEHASFKWNLKEALQLSVGGLEHLPSNMGMLLASGGLCAFSLGLRRRRHMGVALSHSTSLRPLTNYTNKQYMFVPEGSWNFEVVCPTVLSQQKLSHPGPYRAILCTYLLAFFLLLELKSTSSYSGEFPPSTQVFSELLVRWGKLSEQNLLTFMSY